MGNLLFGTAGVPRSAGEPHTIPGLERIKELGLGAMELEFVQGVRMGETLAKEVNQKRQELGLTLTVHAPYFINLNAKEPAKIEASKKRIYDSCRIGALCGAINVTFHAGFYLGDPPEQTFQVIKKNLNDIIQRLKNDKIDIRLTPELTGKASQFGSLEELIRLAKELRRDRDSELPIGMCIDFSHLHARSAGKYNSYKEWTDVLKQIEKEVGAGFLKNLHIHTSGIKYSVKGEQEHLNLPESDMKYQELLKALKEYEVGGVLICESPNLEEDALLMKSYYESLATD
ncbi:MAG TPA: TIM barrel protein [Planctomycetota bacterium]|nr:TIM barrel protein [Planctomycetota bacterium]